MKRWTLLALAATLCARSLPAQVQILGLVVPPPSVATEYDHSVPLARRSYSWGDVQMAVPQYAGTVRAAVDANLQKRGWQLMPSGGSVVVFAHGDIRDEAQLAKIYSASGASWIQPWTAQGLGSGWKPFYGESVFNALNVPENNLIVDMFDSTGRHLLFRGVMQDELSAPEKQTTKVLTKTIKRMFSKFPPKK